MYMQIVFPFAKEGKAFDCFAPLLADLPRVLAWRIKASLATFFEDMLNPLLFEGEQKIPDLQALSSEGLKLLDLEDVMEMEQRAAVTHAELSSVFQAVHALCTMPFSAEVLGCIRECIGPNPYSSAGSPLSYIRLAMQGAQWLQVRAQRFLEAEALLEEKEDRIKSHLESLSQIVDVNDTDLALPAHLPDWSEKFVNLLEDFSVVQAKFGAELLVDHGEAIMTAVSRIVACHMEKAKEAAQSQEWWAALGKLVANCSITFPMEAQVPQWQSEIADLQRAVGVKNLKTTMDEAMDGFLTFAIEELTPELLAKPVAPMKHVADQHTTLSITMQIKVTEMLTRLADAVAQYQFLNCDPVLELMEVCCRFKCGGDVWQKIHHWLQIAVKMKVYEHVVIGDEPPPAEFDFAVVQKKIADLAAAVKESVDITVEGSGYANLDTLKNAMKTFAAQCEVGKSAILRKNLIAAEAALQKQEEIVIAKVW